MNLLLKSLVSLLPLYGLTFPAGPSSAAPVASDDSLAEALPILQSKYPDFNELHYKPGDRLSDLIARSNGKISLNAALTTTPVVSSPIPPVTLPDDILYWRLATFTPEKSWPATAAQLQQAATSTVGVILDLRSNIAPDDYAGAEQVLALFASGDLTLGAPRLSLPNSPSFHSPIIVLTNNQTSGAAEALAACLQADGALVMGRPTAGKMGLFAEQKLSSGQVLRFYVSPIGAGENSPATFKFPPRVLTWGSRITPDVNLRVDDRSERAALTLIRDNQILDVIGESPERHRMSEAALVQGQDPEWDDYLATLERKPVLLSLPVIHDAVLISALDSLKAIRLSERSQPAPVGADAVNPASASLQ